MGVAETVPAVDGVTVAVDDDVADPDADADDGLLVEIAGGVAQSHVVDVHGIAEGHRVAPILAREGAQAPIPLDHQLGRDQLRQPVAVVGRPRLLDRTEQALRVGAHDLGSEARVAFGGLCGGQRDAQRTRPQLPSLEHDV